MGQLVAGLFAWAFLPNYGCKERNLPCTKANNMGWRYVWFANGALVLVMSLLRITVIRLKETPKFLVGEGKDEKVIEVLQGLAQKYNRSCSLTLERMKECEALGTDRRGSVAAHAKSRFSFGEVGGHLRGLFETKRIGLSTSLIWFSWLLIGLAYPLYNVFLPTYLQTRGAKFGAGGSYITWRNYAITNVSGIFGPVLAGYMCASKFFWGRRGTMIIGALLTMIFFFSYTQVRSASQNLGFNCAIDFCLVT
jgi:Major Facilitator Superfamily